MQKVILLIGTVLAGLSVALGAFGAHGLKKMVDPETVANYQTGVQYQMYHALALLILGVLLGRAASSLVHYAGFFFIGGVVFFSGSLYLMASLKAMDKAVPKAVFIMTPIGGLLFILGWVLFLVYLLRQ
ncbi:MAG TPA: DUF423 domain-containing protein [Flavisolibacter sp.]|jgi:uncharacterized membrane protein YgdD (TMEM256/DUF423 family)